jgi:hypothetical protein
MKWWGIHAMKMTGRMKVEETMSKLEQLAVLKSTHFLGSPLLLPRPTGAVNLGIWLGVHYLWLWGSVIYFTWRDGTNGGGWGLVIAASLCTIPLLCNCNSNCNFIALRASSETRQFLKSLQLLLEIRWVCPGTIAIHALLPRCDLLLGPVLHLRHR